jgi:hypothetical protein
MNGSELKFRLPSLSRYTFLAGHGLHIHA